MWKLGSYWRNRLVDEVFEAGYDTQWSDYTRWTKEEMHANCNDLDLLNLWKRYVTYFPPSKHPITMAQIEQEVLAEIAMHDLLVGINSK